MGKARWIGWILVLLVGCQSAKVPLYQGMRYSSDTLATPPAVPVLFTGFFIGDAGHATTAAPVLSMLQEQVKGLPPHRSGVFFLGDNAYPEGLPDSLDRHFGAATTALEQQATAVEDFEGLVWWLPGNHDWGRPAAASTLARQREWVQDIAPPNRRWYPRKMRPFWHLTVLANEVLVVALDSERWLMADEAEVFRQMQYLIDTVAVYKDFPKMLLTHHPAYSDGPHGGRFGIKQHLFPLTDVVDWAYLPLPVVGSLYPLLRSSIGHPQDLTHQRYGKLKHLFNGLLSQYPGWIVLSGHEHALQYIQQGDDHHLIAGSGSKTSTIYPRDHSVFAYSHYGLVQITYYADKTVWVTFWIPDPFEARGKEVFMYRLNGRNNQ